MDKYNKQYGPPFKMAELRFLESYFKRRIHHEAYRHNKHKIHGFASDRQKIIGMLENELFIVQEDIKRRKTENTKNKSEK